MSKKFSVDYIIKKLNITSEDRKKDVFLKKLESGVCFLVLNKKVNTFTTNFIRQIHQLLNEVEAIDGPTALVTFGLNEKFFSTGIDLQFIASLCEYDIHNFILELIRLYGRMLALSVPCIAMINGHAIAGGCMFSFSHDYRVMRNDFGHLCMNEVEIGLPLPPGMNGVVQGKTGNTKDFKDLVLTAKRFSSVEAFKAGWLDFICDPDQLFDQTLKLAESLAQFGQNKENFKKIKMEMNKNAIDCCFNKGMAPGVSAEAKIPSFGKL